MLSDKDVESIKSQINSSIKEAFEKLEGGSLDRIEIPFARPGRVADYLKDNGYEQLNGIDSNGWSWDYWITFLKSDKVYMVSGDGFYQEECTVYFDKYETERYLASKMSQALE